MATRPFDPRPFFVVITMTPVEARDPYRAAALGPFSTEIDSTSSGLMSLIALPKSVPPFGLPPRLAFETGTPSTTNSGLLFPRMEFAPRIVSFVEPPCVPEPVTVRPETLPAS